MTDADAIAALQTWLTAADPSTTSPDYPAVSHAVTRLEALIAVNNEIAHALYVMGVVENQGSWVCVHPDFTEDGFATLTDAAMHWWDMFSTNYHP